jgi:DNA-binding beta-propeller fold protein YncE
MVRPYRLNRIASFVALGVMGLAIVLGARLTGDAAKKAAAPPAGLLVVANLRAESLTFLDLAGSPGARTLVLPGPPHELVAAEGRIYATLGRANAVVELDPRAPGILRTLALEGEPHGLALDGADLLVTLDKGNELVRVDRATLTVRSRVATGETPHSVAAGEGVAFVAISREGLVAAYGAATTMTAPTGQLPESVVVAGGAVVTADSDGGTVSVFARDGLQPRGRVTTGGRPVRLLALDDRHVAVALNGGAAVAVVDVETLKVNRRVTVGARPDGICLDPSGAYAAVASNEAGTVQVFLLPDWKLKATYQAGDGPGACLWIGGR